MTNEMISFGGRPVIRPEMIHYGVVRLGVGGVGLGDVGDLLAYRQEWEPFIAGHLALWKQMNEYLETQSTAKQCPPGIFSASQIGANLSMPTQVFCAQLSLTRTMISDTNIGGIVPRWNAWKDKSSADMIAGASAMLEWHQEVVMGVGGPDKDKLLQIVRSWKLDPNDFKLPDVPPLSVQQDIISRIQGAYITTKGVLQIIGYGANDTLKATGDVAQAVAQGLTDTAKALPRAVNWALIAGAVAVAVVGGALVVYYVPRRSPEPRQI